jgi:hypothetical protein
MRVTGYVITRIENPAVREGILTHCDQKTPRQEPHRAARPGTVAGGLV